GGRAAVGQGGRRGAIRDDAAARAWHVTLEAQRPRRRVDLRLLLPRPLGGDPHLLPAREGPVVEEHALAAMARDVGPRLAHGAPAEDRRDVVRSADGAVGVAHLPLAEPEVEGAVFRTGAAGEGERRAGRGGAAGAGGRETGEQSWPTHAAILPGGAARRCHDLAQRGKRSGNPDGG